MGANGNVYSATLEARPQNQLLSMPKSHARAEPAPERYRVFLDTTRALTGTLSSAELFEAIHRETAEILETAGFYISLYDQGRDLATIVYYADRGDVSRVGVSYRGSDSEVIRTQRASMVNEHLDDRSLLVLGDDDTDVTSSAIAAPMIHKGRMIGAISAQSYDAEAYSEDDLTMLQGIADLSAVAIDNAQQFAELRQRRREAEQIEEIGRALTSELDPKEVLGKVITAVLDVLDVDGASVWLCEGPDGKVGRIAADTFAMEAMSDLSALLSDKGNFDIRLEAAMAKMWNTERGWHIIDETLQVRGGRGYETSASLKARGERPEPVERMMRDFRINLIFEGSSEIMRLFIAREAVDSHLKVAGAIADPKASTGQKVAALVKAGFFYAAWYPARWLGWGRWPRYGEFGKLAKHVRYVNRTARRLSRAMFHAIVRFGPGLEKRQAVLARLVEIGAELFAMSAACSRAQMLVTSRSAEERAKGSGAVRLADVFCRLARRRIQDRFSALFRNDDVAVYKTAQRVMADELVWMEEGLIKAE